MESTPDSGVEMRNAAVAPLLAPCFLRDAAAGSVPQDHRGKGIPKRAALATEDSLPPARCLATVAGLRNAFRRPAARMPSRIYIPADRKNSHEACRI